MTLEERLKAAKATGRRNNASGNAAGGTTKRGSVRERIEAAQATGRKNTAQTSGPTVSAQNGQDKSSTKNGTTTTTLLPMKDKASARSWMAENVSKGAKKASMDRIEQSFANAAAMTPTKQRQADRKASLEAMTEASRKRKAAADSKESTQAEKDKAEQDFRNARDKAEETARYGSPKERSFGESFLLGAENDIASMVGGVQKALGAVGGVTYPVLSAMTSLGGQVENPVSRWADEMADASQTNAFTNNWKASIQRRYQPTAAEQTVMDVTGGIAEMLPALALSAGAGLAAGAATEGAAALNAAQTAERGQRAAQLLMALQGMGGGAAEARSEGASVGQANLYGAADGLLGAATERISGGLPLLGNGLMDKALQKAPGVVRTAADIAGEGLEEALQTAGEPYLKRAIYDPNAKNATAEELARSAAMGSISSAALKLGIEAPQAIGRRIDAAREARDPSPKPLIPNAASGMGYPYSEVGYDGTRYDVGTERQTETPRTWNGDEAKLIAQANAERAKSEAGAKWDQTVEALARKGKGRIGAETLQSTFQSLYDSADESGRQGLLDAYAKMAQDSRWTWDEDGTAWRHDLTKGKNGSLPDPSAPLMNANLDDRKANAVSFDHPELRPYIVSAAEQMKGDLADTQRGERYYISNGNGPGTWSGTKRSTSPDIAAVLDGDRFGTRVDYGTMGAGLDDLIADHGRENSLRAKRMESVLIDRLTDGSQSPDGRRTPPSDQFVDQWNAIDAEQTHGADSPEARAARDKLSETSSLMESEPPMSDTEGFQPYDDRMDERGADIDESGIQPASYREGRMPAELPTRRQAEAEALPEPGRQGEGRTAEPAGTMPMKGGRDVPVYTTLPDGWGRSKGASTAPQGYVWVDNRKSMFGGERQTGLISWDDLHKAEAEGGGAYYGENTVGAAQSAVKPAEPRISQVETNTFTNSGLYADVDREMAGLKAEDLSYDPVSERQSMAHAEERLANDYAGELADLPRRESWSGEDLDTAMGILSNERAKAMQSGDWSEFQKWRKLIQEKGTKAGQMIQAFAKYTRTPEGLLVDAGKTLDETKLSPERKAEVLSQVSAQAARLEDIDTRRRSIQRGDEAAEAALKQDLIGVIRENSAIRKTGGFFGGGQEISKTLEKALQADSFDHLRDVALAQTANIAGDHVSATFLEKVNSFRTMGLLSNLATTARNLTANNVFDALDALASNETVVPLDILLSKFTGTRSVTTGGHSVLNGTKRRGMADGAMKSYIEVALDANAEGAQNRYGQTGTRTFKMTGNVAERFLSTWAKWQGYALNTTDEMQKGGIRAEQEARADKLRDKGLLRDGDESLRERADDTARYRTFQDDTTFSRLAEKGKGALNEIGIGKRKDGSRAIGLGDLVLTFPKVPSNLVSRAVEWSPAGFLKASSELVDVLGKAHRASVDPNAPKVTAAEQARAVNDIGRSFTGSALVALFALMAKNNILKVADAGGEDDANKTALNTAEGVSGTQLNLSAARRLFAGESAEWRDGDTLMSIGYLEPINAHMATGALYADSIEDGDSIGTLGRKLFTASGAGVAQSIKEMPAITGLTDLADQYQYADGDTEGERAANAALGYLEGQASSFVPNIIRSMAKALDPYVRDTNTGGTLEQKTIDSVKNTIPFARETLPTKKDVWGRDRTYGDDQAMNALNSILLPGAVTTYRTTKAAQTLKALPEVQGSPVLPQRSAPKSMSYGGETYQLTGKERSAYQEARGRLHQQLVEGIADTDWYKSASDDEKVSIMNAARAYANDEAKRALVTARGGSYQSSGWEQIHQAVKDGIPAADVFLYRQTRDADGDGTVTQSEAARALLPMKGLSDEQKSKLWKSANSSWSENKDPFLGALPTKAKLTPEKSVELMEEYKAIDKADYSGSGVASQKQTAWSKYLDKAGLSKAQRAVVDDTYKFFSQMPAKVNAYSVETMSEAAQRAWPYLKQRGLRESEFLELYPIYASSETGYKKADKIRDMMALGYSKSQANSIWNILAEAKKNK